MCGRKCGPWKTFCPTKMGGNGMRIWPLFLSGSIALAQTAMPGSISGRVIDPQGASVSGARVKLSQADGTFDRSSTTNPSGVYVFPPSPPGSYRMSVEAPGLAAAAVEFKLDAATPRVQDIEL